MDRGIRMGGGMDGGIRMGRRDGWRHKDGEEGWTDGEDA